MPIRTNTHHAPKTHCNVRPRRVALLAIAMILMGLADLQLSLTYMRSVGMIELNPIARTMIDLGGTKQLVLFKLFTIALSAGLLFLLRKHSIAERCAWASCAALFALTMHWVNFNEHVTDPDVMAASIAQVSTADHRWVALRD